MDRDQPSAAAGPRPGAARRRSLALALLALLVAAPTWSQRDGSAEQQLKFGIRMAERGLWSEARFRFRQAELRDPGNPAVLNNLAVASEALGLFDEALGYYRSALELDPDNKILRRNYSRFVEFYQAYRPREPEPEDAETAEEDAEETDADDTEESTAGAAEESRR